MSWILEALPLLPALLVLPAEALLAAEILASLRPAPVRVPGEAPPYAVIVPAHDEAAVIAATLRTLQPQLRPDDRMLVVADNCTDDTAAIAAAHGVECTRRDDPAHRGKGYALAHGVERVRPWNCPVTIVVDADCAVGEGGLAALSAEVARTGGAVQGDYRLEAPTGASPGQRFSAFAIRVKNRARLLGCRRLGVPCVLTGSGMAFPRRHLEEVRLGSGEIVEDLLLAVELALAGRPAGFCDAARITSPLPIDRAAAERQRARWEGGYLSVMRRYAGRLVAAGVRRGRPDLILFGIDLAIPPLSLLALALVAAFLVALSGYALGGGAGALALASIELGVFGATLALAWYRYGRDLLAPREVALLPLGIVRKLAFYLRLARRPEREWVRTARDLPDGTGR